MGSGVSETHLVGGRVRDGSTAQRALASVPPCRAGMDLTDASPSRKLGLQSSPCARARLAEKAEV